MIRKRPAKRKKTSAKQSKSKRSKRKTSAPRLRPGGAKTMRAAVGAESGEEILLGRHQAALDVIKAHQENGVPFILYLRDFKFALESIGAAVENQLQLKKPEGVNVITLQNPNRDRLARMDTSLPDNPQWMVSKFGSFGDRKAPAFFASDAEWKKIVQYLIQRSRLILVECTSLGAGTLFEVRECIAQQKSHETVLILPDPDIGLKPLDEHSALWQFPRVVWTNQLADVLSSPPVQPLTDRLRQVAALPVAERQRLGKTGMLRASYEGVAEHYVLTAKQYLERGHGLNLIGQRRQGAVDMASWWGTFWNYFRAANLTTLLLKGSTGSLLTNRLLIASTSFLILSRLLQMVETRDGIEVVRGDYRYAALCARQAAKLAREHGGMESIARGAEETARALAGELEAIRSRPTEVRYEPLFTIPIELGHVV